MFETDVADRIATVTLCRAPVNALSEEWGEAFGALLDQLGARDDWTVLHLRSSQKVFAAGADLAQIDGWAGEGRPGPRLALYIERLQAVFAGSRACRRSRWRRSAAPRSAAGSSWPCAATCASRRTKPSSACPKSASA